MRAVIADDAVLVREGIARLLVDAEVEIVGQAGDAEQLLRVVEAERPDVAIVDIRMPPTHTDEGLVAAGEIRARYPQTAVIVLSQHLEPRYAIRLVNDHPARVGYLLKERVARVEELIDALRRVIAGECVVDRAVVQELVQRRRRDDPLETLSPREREILELMAEGRSNQGICEAMWVSPKTVETHIHGVFVKLGLGNVPSDNRRVLAVLAYLRAA
jgi:DNA-binding NarL/FixJ family response regulator